MRTAMLRCFILTLATAAVLGATSCGGSDGPTGDPHDHSDGGPTPPSHSTITISTSLSSTATTIAAAMQDAGIDVDNLRVIITTRGADTLRDTTIAFVAGEAHLTLDVPVISATTLTASVAYQSGTLALFSGTVSAITYDADKLPTTIPTAAISADPSGPGSAAKKVTIAGATTSSTKTPVMLVARALLADDTEIPSAVFGWSVDDPTIATVNSTGVVQPTAKGGTVVVTAVTLSGASAATSVVFYQPPARIIAVDGDGQSGIVGSTLPQPFVVEAQSSTGAPVPGQAVVFGAANGSAVAPTTATTDAQGRAQTSVTLGPTVGAYGFSATTGSFSTTIDATATEAPSAATALQFVLQPTTYRAGVVISPAVTVRAVDALGSVVTSFNGTITLALTSNPHGATLVGTTTRTPVQGVATFDDLMVTQVGAGYAIRATSAGLVPTVLMFDAGPPSGTRIEWVNVQGGSWNTPSNWSANRVPIATDSVVIDLPGTYSVNLDMPFAGNTILLGGASGGHPTLVVASRSLNVTSSLNIGAGAVLNLSNAQLGGAGRLNNGGTIVSSDSSTITNIVTTTSGSVIRLGASGNTTLVVANGFTNNGTVELTGDGATSRSRLVVQVNSLVNGPAGLINASIGGGGTREIDAMFDNRGALNIAAPLALTRSLSSAAHTNSGAITANADFTIRQTIGGSFTNTGALTTNPGRTLRVVNGSFIDQSTATLNGGATLIADSSAAVTVNGGFNFSAIKVLGGAKASFQQSVSTTAIAITLDHGEWGGTGTLTNPAGSTFALPNSTISSPFVNAGTLVATGTSSIPGTFTTTTTSLLTVHTDGATDTRLTVNSLFTNNGTIDVSNVAGGSTYLTVGTLINASGAVINSSASAQTYPQIIAPFSNNGTINVKGILEMNASFGGGATNSGTINLAEGSLFYGQTQTGVFTNAGIINVGTNCAWQVFGGTLTLQPGSTLSGPGTLNVQGATANLNATFALSRLFVILGSVANLTSDISPDVLTVDQSTINGPGRLVVAAGRNVTITRTTIAATSALVNNGSVTIHGTTTVNGAFSNNANASLIVSADANIGNAVFAVPSGFVNNGTMTLTSATAAASTTSTIAVANGTLTNASFGTITSSIGGGGARLITGNLVNAGTVTVAPGGAGSLHISGSFASTPTSVLNMELGGPTSADYDALQSDGQATLAGTLNVSYINGYVAPPGTIFTILTYPSVAGSFSTTNLPSGNWGQASAGSSYQISRQP